ncbi:MAG: NADH:ubiquinone reductase (Na(+)-transporting) subunit B [Saprospiraceae bacterium]|nr:NADH:ubiquinone reductase (Na(+)-transporting) subunit B [Saprospiraceae bacterium]
MKQTLLTLFKRLEPKKGTIAHTAYDAFFTFAFTPNEVTHNGVHVRDGMDLKRTMVQVVLAMQLCYLFGTYNIGHQHFAAIGQYTEFFAGFHLKLVYGFIQLLPIWVVTHAVGLGIEFFYAYKRGHAVEEGFLVSGALIPLIMPPDIPMWILVLAVAFAVIIGKEAFGGTGMNILNIALLARVFVFFAYPTYISGDEVWISGIEKVNGQYIGDTYGWAHGLFDWIFKGFGWATFGGGGVAVVDGYTGATPLALAYQGGWEKVTSVYSATDMFWGNIPGSIGETSKPFIVIGALYLIIIGIASWRIMVSMVLGMITMGLIYNGLSEANLGTAFMAVPWYYHFYMGSFLFAMAFMATDPVTAASTNTGKWIYGFMIGFIGLIIRVSNQAYPEGWMLAILFMNVFAPLIDHMVLQRNINRRLKRAKASA